MRDHQARQTTATTFSRRDMILAGGALTIGAAALAAPRQAKATAPAGAEPSVWVDPAMPDVTHRMIAANGIHLHVAEQGKGPLVILCHGFPECWYSWRHQLPALAKAGYRAVAPDLRGYGRSDNPAELEKYTLLHHLGDVVGLVEALGEKQAFIAGHDIGATVAWQAALMRPDVFRGVIAMSPPFRSRAFGGDVPPTTLMPKTEDAVFYQLFLQTPEAEAALSRDLRLTFRGQLYSLSGDRPQGASGGFPGGMMPRKGARLTNPDSLPSWITEADIDVYVAEYTRSGFHGPLAWWRNIDRNWELMAPFAGDVVSVPALYIAGERDFVVAAYAKEVAAQKTLVPKLRSVMLPGCGHWTEQERASEVSAAMIEFLRSV